MSIPARLQDLPSAQAHLCLKVRSFLTPFLAAPPPFVLNVAFSGGTDSTALLLILHYLAPALDLRLHAVHLDHSLRPESAEDAEHCAALCADLGIPFHHKRMDVAAIAATEGMGTEEAARTCRYDWFVQARERTGATWTLLAHQLNDLAEDILMRLLRGAGWPGLGGMAEKDTNRRILRPTLMIPRIELAALLTACGIACVDDASNTDQRYLRNRVRHSILPLFLAENPAFLESAAALHRSSQQDAELFQSLLPAPAEHLSRDLLLSLPKALRLRLYKSCLDTLGSGQALASSLATLDALFEQKKSGTTVQFPGGKIAVLTAEGISFSRPE